MFDVELSSRNVTDFFLIAFCTVIVSRAGQVRTPDLCFARIARKREYCSKVVFAESDTGIERKFVAESAQDARRLTTYVDELCVFLSECA